MKSIDRSVVLADMALGNTQHMTPEGFLMCQDVPIARIGVQQYLNEELAPEIDGGADGVIHVERRPEDVFDDRTLRSFEGKPVIDDHPDTGELLGPETFKEHVVGVTLNVRRGDAAMEDFIIADLLIMDAAAIAAVRAGKREVSCGYDAEYEQISPGRARQFKIVGNHVALVTRGRCGPRCAIGDEDMTAKKKGSWFDRAMAAFYTKDEEGFAEAMKEGKKGEEDAEGAETPAGVHVHIHGAASSSGSTAGVTDEEDPENMEAAASNDEEGEKPPKWFEDHVASNNARFDSVEKALAALANNEKGENDETAEEVIAEEGEEEAVGNVADSDEEEEGEMDGEMPEALKEAAKSKATGDSAPLASSFREVLSGAEILSPGIKFPTFDKKLDKKNTLVAMDTLKRRSLRAHAATSDGAAAIMTLTGKKEFTTKGLSVSSVDTLFRGAVGLAKARNSRGTVDLRAVMARENAPRAPLTVKELNEMNRKTFN